MSHLGPAQKVVVPQPMKKAVAAKAGAKRTALGGVVANGAKEDFEDMKKPCELLRIVAVICLRPQ